MRAVAPDARSQAHERALADRQLRAEMRAAQLRTEQQVAQHRTRGASAGARFGPGASGAAPVFEGGGVQPEPGSSPVSVEELHAFLELEEPVITDTPEESSKPGIGTYIWVALMLFTMVRNCL